MQPLRLVVYDATQQRRPPRTLGMAWRLGTSLYRGLGHVDAALGAVSFAEALAWLAQVKPDRPIGELQFWGHGKWGRALIERESFDRSALEPGHPFETGLRALRERLAPDPLVWFRTCETLGALAGHDFARALGDYLGARVAGHTFVIGYFQSGLHSLAPGMAPSWSPAEGLSRGTPAMPEAALGSARGLPNTVTCFDSKIPDGF